MDTVESLDTLESLCEEMNQDINRNAKTVKALMNNDRFKGDEAYAGQFGEMKANIMLTYRHLEDARMRVGKILQAAGDGVSILDK